MSDRRDDRRDDRGRGDVACKVYIGDLPRDATEKEIERTFGHYGALRSVWVAQDPAGFAFCEYEDARDAADAVRGLDGTNLCGSRVRVEHSRGRSRRGGGGGWRGGGGRGGGGGFRGGRGFNPDDRCYECGGTGHYAYDCPRSSSSSSRRGGGGGGGGYGGGGGGRRGGSYRSRSKSPRRRSYSRSRSRSQGRRSRSGSPGRK